MPSHTLLTMLASVRRSKRAIVSTGSSIRWRRRFDNREKVGAVAGDVESAIAEAKKALAEGGVERLNEAFNQLQTASHKLAEALYQQAPPPGAEPTGDQ